MQEQMDSSSDTEQAKEEKKLCKSLGVSGTCDKLGEICLDSSSESREGLRNDERGECLRNDSSDTILDLSYLLEDTKGDGEVRRLIREAQALVEEVLDIELASASDVSTSEAERALWNIRIHWGPPPPPPPP